MERGLVGTLVGSFDRSSVSRLVGWSDIRLFGWLIRCLVGGFGWLVGWFVALFVGRFYGLLVCWLVDLLDGWLLGWLVG